MKFVRIGSCETVSPGGVVVVDPFFAWRESFSLCDAVSVRTLPPLDISQKKVVRDVYFQHFSGMAHSFS